MFLTHPPCHTPLIAISLSGVISFSITALSLCLKKGSLEVRSLNWVHLQGDIKQYWTWTEKGHGGREQGQLGTDTRVLPLNQCNEYKWGYHMHYLYQREEVRAEMTKNTMYHFWSLGRGQTEWWVKVLRTAVVFPIFKDFSIPFLCLHGPKIGLAPLSLWFCKSLFYELHLLSKIYPQETGSLAGHLIQLS